MLRIQELISSLKVSPAKLEQLVDELVSAQLLDYKKLYLKDRTIQSIIVVDDYVAAWAAKKTKGSNETLKPSSFDEIFEMLRTKSRMESAKAMDIPEERVPLVYISAILIRRIVDLMGASKIWVPGVTLCDGITYEYGEHIKMFQKEHDFEQDILACAMNISKRYQGSRKRAQTLENISTTIFDSMKKVHGMGQRERLYLCLAAILHDCGKYISLVNIGETSYDIIMATEIIGLSHREREMVASIVRFNHSDFTYGDTYTGKRGADEATYLTVAKLTAILRLASGLDRSHKQKFKDLKAVLRDNELHLSAVTGEDTLLELSYFTAKAAFFREVFSITPVIKQQKQF